MRQEHEELLDVMTTHRQLLTIVEGKNDKRALERVGFSNIRTLNKPLYQIIEDIDEEEVIILTDLDSHGNMLYRQLFHECNRRGIRVNNRVRQLLAFSELRQIEGLTRFLEH